jgi:hypothetical protein
VDRVHATVNHAMFPSPWVRHGPNNGRRSGLAGVAPCGRSGGREIIARGLGRGGADGESCGGVGGA